MEKNLLFSSVYGAIIGDMVGSRFEYSPIKSKDFELMTKENGFINDKQSTKSKQLTHFTDDTVMTIAVLKALYECAGDYTNLEQSVVSNMQTLGKKYPLSGYGYNFYNWLYKSNPQPYNSLGNGSAMRISPVSYFAKSLEEVIDLSKKITSVTHNHPEGIKGAEAVAVSIWMAKNNYSKEQIKQYIEDYYYNLDFVYEELVKKYRFDETCPGSVPQSLYAFFISDSYEDTIRTAVSMGGDADTMADIAGAIAAEFYGIPYNIVYEAQKFLPQEFKDILKKFER